MGYLGFRPFRGEDWTYRVSINHGDSKGPLSCSVRCEPLYWKATTSYIRRIPSVMLGHLHSAYPKPSNAPSWQRPRTQTWHYISAQTTGKQMMEWGEGRRNGHDGVVRQARCCTTVWRKDHLSIMSRVAPQITTPFLCRTPSVTSLPRNGFLGTFAVALAVVDANGVRTASSSSPAVSEAAFSSLAVATVVVLSFG